MTRAMKLTVLATAAALTLPALPAAAQIGVYVTPQPAPPIYVHPTPNYTYDVPRHGPFGDRDRDGVPNIADNYDNRLDRDRDRRWGRRDNDGDGVPNRWDSAPNNPYRQ